MESFSLDWNEYNDHLKDLMFKMIKTTEYSDVTLMCDDFQFNAHKSILSACSPELCKIIQLTPEKNPVIYLRGVHSKEMEALIEFMYLGSTRIKQNDLQELLVVAQDLKIKGIGDQKLEKTPFEPNPRSQNDEVMIMGNAVLSEDSESFFQESIENEQEMGEEDANNASEITPAKRGQPRPSLARKLENDIIKDEDSKQGQANSQGKKGPIECPECHKMIMNPYSLKIHMEAIHQGIRYYCNFCDKSSTTKANLNRHIANVHSDASFQ